jgi:hypothetical protein
MFLHLSKSFVLYRIFVLPGRRSPFVFPVYRGQKCDGIPAAKCRKFGWGTGTFLSHDNGGTEGGAGNPANAIVVSESYYRIPRIQF